MRNFLLWLFFMLLLVTSGTLFLLGLAVVSVLEWVVGCINNKFDELFEDF